MKKINIALCGTGNVGSSFIDLVLKNKQKMMSNFDIDINLTLIGSRKGEIDNTQFEGTIEKDILKVPLNAEIDVVIELIGGTDISYDLAKLSLENGKHFVTANKALIAEKGSELFELASKKNLHLGFEASVGGGIPIIRTLRDGLISNRVNWFKGILNGTSNYILSKMFLENQTYESALKSAQELGFAEPDPTFDIDGTDAYQKTSILSFLSFNGEISLDKIYREGINKIESLDMEYGKELGFVIKPLSLGINYGEKLFIGSFPAFIKENEILANVNFETNVIEVNSENLNSTAYQGPGAGGYPTSTSVMNDLIDIGKGKVFDYFNLLNPIQIDSFDEFKTPRYLRLMVKDEPGVVAEISKLIAEKNLSIDNLIQKEKQKSDEIIPIVIVLGECSEKVVNSLIKELEKLPKVKSPIQQIRFIN
ncbi:MAG: homoserine dehydrogenase [Gammaproteobacteria bacterium]|nr:MAG: homoserine dehydrogenase [Gammaproteobacteria bacterium]